MIKNSDLLQEKIGTYLNRIIAGGTLKKGDRLVSERELAKMFNASVRPVRIAVDRLIAKGIVRREHGRGMFVEKVPRTRRTRTNTLGVIHPHDQRGFFSSSYFNTIFDGIQVGLENGGLKMYLRSLSASESGAPDKIITGMAGEVDGFLLVGMRREIRDETVAALRSTGKPVVTVSFADDESGFASVMPDNRGNMHRLTDALIRAGHTGIAYVFIGPARKKVWEENAACRYAGYRDALAAAGLAYRPELTGAVPVLPQIQSSVQQYFTVSNTGSPLYRRYNKTYRAYGRLLKKMMRLAVPPTAIVCPSDESAYPVLVMAKELGLRVPGDLSVAAHDNLPESEMVNPGLTTVNGRMVDQGMRAVELLENLIVSPDGAETRVRLAGEIIERQSHRSI